MWYPELKLNQINEITFAMVDVSYTEVPGLGAAVNLFIRKASEAHFVPSLAVIAEIDHGWYSALLPADECDTIGPLSVYATGAGCIQQNLEYVVRQRNSLCIEFTYTLTNAITLNPVSDANIWVTTDITGNNVIWNGKTNVLGIAVDSEGDLPCLDAGTYYFWATKSGMSANSWPDTEIVS